MSDKIQKGFDEEGEFSYLNTPGARVVDGMLVAGGLSFVALSWLTQKIKDKVSDVMGNIMGDSSGKE